MRPDDAAWLAKQWPWWKRAFLWVPRVRKAYACDLLVALSPDPDETPLLDLHLGHKSPWEGR